MKRKLCDGQTASGTTTSCEEHISFCPQKSVGLILAAIAGLPSAALWCFYIISLFGSSPEHELLIAAIPALILSIAFLAFEYCNGRKRYTLSHSGIEIDDPYRKLQLSVSWSSVSHIHFDIHKWGARPLGYRIYIRQATEADVSQIYIPFGTVGCNELKPFIPADLIDNRDEMRYWGYL